MDELTPDEIARFLDSQTVGRLGCHDAGFTYVVPLIYARHDDALYIMTTDGQKVRAARRNPAVCFEVDQYDAATGSWMSVIVQGRYEELGPDGAAAALAILTARFGGRRGALTSASQPIRPTVAFRIRIAEATGRAVKRG
jgi:uncharacterized protein